MTSMTYPKRGQNLHRVPAEVLSVVKKGQRQPPTTTIERLLLMATIVIFPLEPYLPVFGGVTTPYIVFAISAGYVLLHRPGTLARAWSHPVFLAAFVLLILGVLIESAHPLSSYIEVFRTGQAFIAAICVASLCRDRRALRASIYSFLIVGVMVSIFLFFTGYGALQQTTAADFAEASAVRGRVFEDVQANTVPVFAAQGAAVALALGLTARSPRRGMLLLGIALFCLVGAFLPMSRGGMVIVVASCASVMFAYGVRHVRVLLIATALAIGVLIWVPEAVLARMTVKHEFHEGEGGSRTRIYKAALGHLPEYILIGVGAGNFKGPWGEKSAYYNKRYGVVYGAHNAFIQVAIYWGLAGFSVLIWVVYLTYRCFPRGGNKDALVLCLYGIAVSLLLHMMVAHGLTFKGYSLGLGLLVGGRLWIWPKGIVPSLRRGQNSRYPTFKHAS
jgi:hypothetical protein